MLLLVILSLAVVAKSIYHYDYEDHTQKSFTHRYNDDDEDDNIGPPPIEMSIDTTIFSKLPTVSSSKSPKNQSCDNFNDYAVNCTIKAAVVFNSSKKSPPPPTRLLDWCSAIRTLTNCALDWNTVCKERSEDYFNEESIQGHIHVLEHICDDPSFLIPYKNMEWCINQKSDAWEACYTAFKMIVDQYKNSTKDWTHYETHFHLCCARTQFRRCTLDAVFNDQGNCTHAQAVVLQKFSTVVSEGDVYQDCEVNVMYTNCPYGDPRPTNAMLSKLMAEQVAKEKKKSTASADSNNKIALWLLFAMFFVLYYR